jgi:hypothetical protein
MECLLNARAEERRQSVNIVTPVNPGDELMHVCFCPSRADQD